MAVNFVWRGVNDTFAEYAATWGDPDKPTRDARGCQSTTIRTNVFWNAVQTAGPNTTPQWSVPGLDYEGLRYYAQAHNLKVLPVVVGCPDWVPSRLACQGTDPNFPIYYPIQDPDGSGTSLYYWGQFVSETVKFFDACGTIDAIEIWNEPNVAPPQGQVGNSFIPDASRYSSMLGSALCAMNDGNSNGTFTHYTTNWYSATSTWTARSSDSRFGCTMPPHPLAKGPA